MKTVLAVCGTFLAVLILSLGIGWVVAGNDFFMFKFFAPKEEAVRREVFKQSQAYNDGMMQELYQMQRDYLKAKSPEEKVALRSIILHRSDAYDVNMLPNDLRSFILRLRMEASQ